MRYIFFLLTILFICSCTSKLSTPLATTVANSSSTVSMTAEDGLVHTVFFWYADDADPARLAEFENDLKELGKVPSISSYYYGPPAATAERGPVDHSYDMAINVFFKDIAAHDAYQIDPIHLAFVEKCKDLWEKVVVYDNQISR